jgi:hypothetical protein
VTVTFSDGLNSQTLKTTGGGHYALVVRSGWRGIVRPSLSGYYFLPDFATLGPVQRDVVQDFILSPLHAGPLRKVSPMMATR